MTEKFWENIAKDAAFEGGRGGPLNGMDENGVWELKMSLDFGLGLGLGMDKAGIV